MEVLLAYTHSVRLLMLVLEQEHSVLSLFSLYFEATLPLVPVAGRAPDHQSMPRGISRSGSQILWFSEQAVNSTAVCITIVEIVALGARLVAHVP